MSVLTDMFLCLVFMIGGLTYCIGLCSLYIPDCIVAYLELLHAWGAEPRGRCGALMVNV